MVIGPEYAVPAAVVVLLSWRVYASARARRQIPAFLAEGAQVVDVRTSREYASGHAPNSVNIPLDSLDRGLGRLDRNRPVIVCCASGTRSAMAATVLRGKGFKRVLNGGPWRNLLQNSKS